MLIQTVLIFTSFIACIQNIDGDNNLGGRGLLGGKSRISEEDSRFLQFAWKAAVEVNKKSNSFHHFIPIRVAKVEKQVVNGLLYHMQVIYGQSTCKANQVKIEDVTEELCQLKSHGHRICQKCYITVWQQPLEKSEKITNKGCQPCSKKETTVSNKSHKQKKPIIGRELLIKEPKTLRKALRLPMLSPKDKYAWVAFSEFLEKFGKSYKGGRAEFRQRYRTFSKNMQIIEQLQANEKGSAKYGITKFADMTPREFKRRILTPDWKDVGYPLTYAEIPSGNVPDSWDWRKHNAVSPVKNQGTCGSCWAFSTTGNIEGQWAIKKGKLLSLSEQELVDCDKLDQGCNGGLPANAYREIMRLGGLETEKDYPYDGHGEACSLNRNETDVYINSSVKISKNEDEMKAWLFKNGPISIGINAFPMQFYWGGVSHPWRIFCSPKHLNHGVLIVGYGVKHKKPYWIIKNSWGANWGEKGYYLAYRGAGVCGLNTMCTSAIVN